MSVIEEKELLPWCGDGDGAARWRCRTVPVLLPVHAVSAWNLTPIALMSSRQLHSTSTLTRIACDINGIITGIRGGMGGEERGTDCWEEVVDPCWPTKGKTVNVRFRHPHPHPYRSPSHTKNASNETRRGGGVSRGVCMPGCMAAWLVGDKEEGSLEIRRRTCSEIYIYRAYRSIMSRPSWCLASIYSPNIQHKSRFI